MGGTAPQSMWLWPGLRVIGAGGAVKKGVFETVATASHDEVTLRNGTRLTANQTKTLIATVASPHIPVMTTIDVNRNRPAR